MSLPGFRKSSSAILPHFCSVFTSTFQSTLLTFSIQGRMTYILGLDSATYSKFSISFYNLLSFYTLK